MVDSETVAAFQPGYFAFAEGYSGKKLPLDELVGARQTKKTMACLQHALLDERLKLIALGDECSRRDAESRVDIALMAVGLLRYDRERSAMMRTGGILSRIRHWQVEQARALIHLSPDELCQEALWRVDTLPALLVESLFSRTLRVQPGEPAILPVTLCDFWNAGLFDCALITAARMLECRSRSLEWMGKRCSVDPRVMLAYLRTLETRLRQREESLAVGQLLKRVEEALPLWKEGYQLGEDFFRYEGVVDGGMRTGLQVMVQHLYEAQKDQDFPWRDIIDEKSLGVVYGNHTGLSG